MPRNRTDIDVNIRGNASGVEAAAARADKAVGNLSKQLGKQFSGLTGQVFSLRGALGGLLAGFSLKKVIDATTEQERVTRQLEAVLKSTKGAAGLTRDELLSMAAGLQQVTTYGDEAVIGAQNLLLTFTQIGRDVFPQALETVLDMSTAMGTDLKGSAIQLGKALNDPVKGVSALAEVGVNFTEATKEQIKALVESGRTIEAQRIILAELRTEFGDSARAARDTFGGALAALKNALGNLLEADGEGLSDATKAINDLTETLNDPDVKRGFQTLTQAVLTLTAAFARGVPAVVDFAQWLGESLAAAVGGPAIGDLVRLNEELGKVNAQLEKQDRFAASGNRFLTRQRESELRARKKVLESMIELSREAAKPLAAAPAPTEGDGTPSGTPTPLDSKEVEKRAKAAAGAAAAIYAAELARASATLESSYKRRIITIEQYYQEKRDLDLGAIDEEIAARETALTRADAAERIRLNGEIESLRIKRVAAAEQIARDEAQALSDERDRLQKEELSKIDQRVKEITDAYARAQQASANAVATGASGQAGAQSATREAAQQAIDGLQPLRAQLQALANQDAPGAQQALDALNDSMRDIGQSAQTGTQRALADLNRELAGLEESFPRDAMFAFRDELKSVFDEIEDGSARGLEAVDSFVKGVARSVLDLIQQQLATRLASSLFGGLLGGGGGGVTAAVQHVGGMAGSGPRRTVPALAFAAAPRYHGGSGVLGLKPDERAAILQTGERVQSRAEVQRGLAAGGAAPVYLVLTPDMMHFTIADAIERFASRIGATQ